MAAPEAPAKNGRSSAVVDGRLALSAMATEIVPGPVVKGIVSGKKATSQAGACGRCRVLLLAILVLFRAIEHSPTARRDDETSGDAQRIDADAEEAHQCRAYPECRQHDDR